MTTTERTGYYDQFDFEQQIMDCWNVISDVKAVSEYLLDAPLETGREDKIANMLIGIETLYDVKFNKLFRMFEQFNSERYRLLKEKANNSSTGNIDSNS